MTHRLSPFGRAVILAALLAVVPAMGELTVIHEAPGTRPLSDFLGKSGQTPTPRPLPQPPAAWDLRSLLPIHSPGLTPGPVAAREHALSLAQPVFLIGADALSKAWLARHRARLEALGAIGLLVEAETQADLEAIAELAGVLPIVPAPATDIAAILGLRHYPVCITPSRLWQ
jgi:integrating conjugative element protein (TIGR03765 family)